LKNWLLKKNKTGGIREAEGEENVAGGELTGGRTVERKSKTGRAFKRLRSKQEDAKQVNPTNAEEREE